MEIASGSLTGELLLRLHVRIGRWAWSNNNSPFLRWTWESSKLSKCWVSPGFSKSYYHSVWGLKAVYSWLMCNSQSYKDFSDIFLTPLSALHCCPPWSLRFIENHCALELSALNGCQSGSKGTHYPCTLMPILWPLGGSWALETVTPPPCPLKTNFEWQILNFFW